jgi:hypothetical protein
MQEIQETLVEVALASGLVILVRRLNAATRILLLNDVEKKYPFPDPANYIQPLSEVAPNAIEGAMIPADENPAYMAARGEIEEARKRHLVMAVFSLGVVVDTVEGRETTIERYEVRIQKLKAALSTELPEDKWQATVRYGLISTADDLAHIFNAAWNVLRQDEVRLAIRSFRRDV